MVKEKLNIYFEILVQIEVLIISQNNINIKMINLTEDVQEFLCVNLSENDIIIKKQIIENILLARLMLIVLGIVGILFCILCFVLVARYRNHILIKASGRFNTLIIILGLFIGNIVILFCTLNPSPELCTFILFADYLCFGIVFSSLLVKTILISRIYFGSLKGQTRFSCVSSLAILAQVSFLITFEVYKFSNFSSRAHVFLQM